MSWFFSSSPKQKFVMFEEYGVNFPNLLYHTDKCIIIFPWGGECCSVLGNRYFETTMYYEVDKTGQDHLRLASKNFLCPLSILDKFN
jgi:hypothetical protein